MRPNKKTTPYKFIFDNPASQYYEMLGLKEEDRPDTNKIQSAYTKTALKKKKHPDTIKPEKDETDESLAERRAKAAEEFKQLTHAKDELILLKEQNQIGYNVTIKFLGDDIYEGDMRNDFTAFISPKSEQFVTALLDGLRIQRSEISSKQLEKAYTQLESLLNQKLDSIKIAEIFYRNQIMNFDNLIVNLQQLLPKKWQEYTQPDTDNRKALGLLQEVNAKRSRIPLDMQSKEDKKLKANLDKERAMLQLNIKINECRDKIANKTLTFDEAKEELQKSISEVVIPEVEKKQTHTFAFREREFNLRFKNAGVTNVLQKFIDKHLTASDNNNPSPNRRRSNS